MSLVVYCLLLLSLLFVFKFQAQNFPYDFAFSISIFLICSNILVKYSVVMSQFSIFGDTFVIINIFVSRYAVSIFVASNFVSLRFNNKQIL